MAPTALSSILCTPFPRLHNALPGSTSTVSPPGSTSPPPKLTVHVGRRHLAFLLTSAAALKALESPALAKDIPLFGLRKKLEIVEKEAEEVVKESIEATEKGIETVEKEIETAEKGIETAVRFDKLAQAGVVAGAEVLGVLVATSVVNGILGPQAPKS
ncbi:hypothetical protein Dimus_017080 [Dionaea muscipula]